MKTFVAREDQVKREWYLVDATDKPVGRLAVRIASRPGIPSRLSRRIVSTFTIASFTEMPSRAINPIREMTFIDCPARKRVKTAPMMLTGRTAEMIRGSRNDSNCAARIM